MVGKVNRVEKVIPMNNHKKKKPSKDDFKKFLNRPPDGPNDCA